MTRWMALLPNGELREYDDEPTLARMQEEAHGNLTAVKVPDPHMPVSLFVNEEKQTLDGTPLALNPKAYMLLHAVLWPGDRIHGPLLITGLPNGDGDLNDLTAEAVVMMKEKLA